MSIERPPNQYEQAKEAARDGLDARELANLLYDLPCVYELMVDGRNEEWRPTAITVGFDDYRGTGDVLDIMRAAGWKAEKVTFCYHRIRFEERTDTDSTSYTDGEGQ